MKDSLVKTVALGLCLSHAACEMGDRNSSRLNEFVKVEPDHEFSDPEGEKIDFKLRKAGDIPYSVVRRVPKYSEEDLEDDTNDPMSNDGVYYDITFGKLTKDQFETLQRVYHKNPSATYSSAREYALEDFMPPQIQALKGLRFESEEIDSEIPFPSADGRPRTFILNALSNCWNAAYEVVRDDPSKTYLYYVDSKVADSVLHDERYSTVVKTFNFNDWTSPAAAENRNAGLEPNDIILVYGKSIWGEGLQHVAVFLDNDLYFEKTGPDRLMNYRFAPFSDIAETYSEYSNTRVEVRRFKRGVLPPAPEVFTFAARGTPLPEAVLQSQDLLNAYPELPKMITESNDQFNYVMVDARLRLNTGTQRYELDPAAFNQILRGEKID